MTLSRSEALTTVAPDFCSVWEGAFKNQIPQIVSPTDLNELSEGLADQSLAVFEANKEVIEHGQLPTPAGLQKALKP